LVLFLNQDDEAKRLISPNIRRHGSLKASYTPRRPNMGCRVPPKSMRSS
ncbi:hypothetical protein RRG08_012009, partial [Elysia crispata]